MLISCPPSLSLHLLYETTILSATSYHPPSPPSSSSITATILLSKCKNEFSLTLLSFLFSSFSRLHSFPVFSLLSPHWSLSLPLTLVVKTDDVAKNEVEEGGRDSGGGGCRRRQGGGRCLHI